MLSTTFTYLLTDEDYSVLAVCQPLFATEVFHVPYLVVWSLPCYSLVESVQFRGVVSWSRINVNMVLTSTEITRLIRVMRGGGGEKGGGSGRLYTCRYSVTTRMSPALSWAAMRAILMFHSLWGETVHTHTHRHAHTHTIIHAIIERDRDRQRESDWSVAFWKVRLRITICHLVKREREEDRKRPSADRTRDRGEAETGNKTLHNSKHVYLYYSQIQTQK